MNTRFQDLAYEQLDDGTIRLEQIGYAGETALIDLHPVQLRHVAESFGLVAPTYPADELSKTLAWQLCDIHRELADECHRSHWLGLTFAKLDGYCASIPEAIHPGDVWSDEQPERTAGASKPTAATVSPKTQPTAIADVGTQLGLAV